MSRLSACAATAKKFANNRMSAVAAAAVFMMSLRSRPRLEALAGELLLVRRPLRDKAHIWRAHLFPALSAVIHPLVLVRVVFVIRRIVVCKLDVHQRTL